MKMRIHKRLFKVFGLIMIILIVSCHKKNLKSDQVNALLAFPQHSNYISSHIKPSNYTQTELDNHTTDFYNEWKKKYVRSYCEKDQFLIKSSKSEHTISEAHGYGMMIMCFMAGHEKSAKQYFDGMFRYFKSHPSRVNSKLMDWKQIACDEVGDDDNDSASDGDIDIAFALLLADRQWGSDGDINYFNEAITMINAIFESDINPITKTVKLGDWCNTNETSYYFGTRTSDFICSHFRSFEIAGQNTGWTDVIDKCYALIPEVQNTTTGLVPDFITNTDGIITVAPENYLESKYDNSYSYNACRFPWRIGVDYLLNGDSNAQLSLLKINSWLKSSTNSDLSKLSNGYLLDGTPIFDWADPTFLAPFTVGAMADVDNQEWLNLLYKELIEQNKVKDNDYYANTIELLCLITISGNYWSPN